MKYIVHGATGAQGNPVLTALHAAGHQAVAAVRNPEKASGPAIAIDDASVDSLVAAYTGAQGVFVHLPLGSPEQQTEWANNIAKAIIIAHPNRVVFSTSGSFTGLADSVLPTDRLAAALEASSVSYAVVAPCLYLENLLLPVIMDPVLQQGVLRYPVRTDCPVSWISHLDMADIIVRLLTDDSVSGVVGAGALPPLCGPDLAEGFSRYLGRPIAFESLDPLDFGELIIPIFGEESARPVIGLYQNLQTSPGLVIDESRSAQRLLGITPRSVDHWLRDLGI